VTLPTPGQAIRHQCRDCLGLERGQRALDCLSALCPLRPYSPFLGKSASKDEPAVKVKRKRASRRAIKIKCRECLGVQETGRASGDCEGTECALYPLRPTEIGGPRRTHLPPEGRPPKARAGGRFVSRDTPPPLE
jgi:hypothetical protein